MSKDTAGREPLQILELHQPLCSNTYGVSPCTASGNANAKCYNTRATCQDTANFALSPEAGLGDPKVVGKIGTSVDQTLFNRSADLVFAIDMTLDASGDGCFLEIGNTVAALYFGITAGRLIFRAGGGATGTPTDAAKIDVDAVAWRNKSGTFIGAIDVSAKSVSLYFYDESRLTATLVASATASGTLLLPHIGNALGGIGYVEGTTAVGEDVTTAPSTIAQCRIYDNTALFALPSAGEYFIRLRYGRGNVAESGITDAPYIVPSLQSISTSPTKINMNMANPDARGLGNRAVCTVVLQDHQHTDNVVDPYLTDRTWDPLSIERGTYWARWFVRNKYRLGMRMVIYEGYAGQTLVDMWSREYFVSDARGPTSAGTVTLQGKDVLSRLEERKAQCPVASPGVLATNLNATDAAFSLAGAILADYPSSGILRLEDELVSYTGIVESGSNLNVMGVSRGQFNSVAVEHAFDVTVQECVQFPSQGVNTALETLLVKYGGISRSWLDTANWATEVDTYLGFYNVQALITEPTAVEDLAAELQTQCLFYTWWCECDSTVKMAAIAGLRSTIPTITDAENVKAGTLEKMEHERRRLSRVWISYDQDNYVADMKTTAPFKTTFVLANLEAETTPLYGTPAITKLYSRWLNSDVLVHNTARKILVRQVDPPETIKFQLDAKDNDIWTGDKVYLDHFMEVDQYGARRLRIWTITSAEAIVPGESIQYEAENTTAYGISNFIMATGAADYTTQAARPDKHCFIGDSAGKLAGSSSPDTITDAGKIT